MSKHAVREKLTQPSYDLIPFQEFTDAYQAAAEHGAKKYAAWNWAKGLPLSQILSSLLRHSFKRLRGEIIDPDSGIPHSCHIVWNAVTLAYHEQHNMDIEPKIREMKK